MKTRRDKFFELVEKHSLVTIPGCRGFVCETHAAQSEAIVLGFAVKHVEVQHNQAACPERKWNGVPDNKGRV